MQATGGYSGNPGRKEEIMFYLELGDASAHEKGGFKRRSVGVVPLHPRAGTAPRNVPRHSVSTVSCSPLPTNLPESPQGYSGTPHLM